MSSTDVTQPAPPTWQPTPTQVQPPVRKRRRPSKRLVAVLLAVLVAVAAIATLTVTTVQQHGKAVDARSTLADTRTELKGTKAVLTTTQGDLSTTKADLATTQSSLDSTQSSLATTSKRLGTCQLLTDVSTHLLQGFAASNDASIAEGDGDLVGAISKLNEAKSAIEAVNSLLAQEGYDSVPALAEACDPASANA